MSILNKNLAELQSKCILLLIQKWFPKLLKFSFGFINKLLRYF